MASNGSVRRSQPKSRQQQARHTTNYQQTAWQPAELQLQPHIAVLPPLSSGRSSLAPVSSNGASSWLDVDCDRAWACLQSSLLSDALQRIQQNREVELSSSEQEREQQQQRSPSHGKKRITLREQLNEEWRQASEDALIARAARSDFFIGTTAVNVAAHADKASPSTARRQLHREAPPAQLQRWSDLIAKRYAASGWPAPSNLPPSHVFSQRNGDALMGPEHLFAATSLDMLQAPISKSGLDTVEIQRALQLQLQQMSQRVQLGLMQFPVAIVSTLQRMPNPFLRVLGQFRTRAK